jgi:hypothetical protein
MMERRDNLLRKRIYRIANCELRIANCELPIAVWLVWAGLVGVIGPALALG